MSSAETKNGENERNGKKRPKKEQKRLKASKKDKLNEVNEAECISSKIDQTEPDEFEPVAKKSWEGMKGVKTLMTSKQHRLKEAEIISFKKFPPNSVYSKKSKKLFRDITCVGCGYYLIEPYIVCNECNDCCICIDCFQEGYEDEIHKKTHDYRVRTVDFSLLEDDWTACEEYEMLNNLRVPSDYYAPMKTKTAEQCRKHYEDFYIKKYKDHGFPQMLLDESEARWTQPNPIRLVHSMHPPRHCANSDTTIVSMCGYSAGRGDFVIPYDDGMEKELFESIDVDECERPAGLLKRLEVNLTRGIYHRFDERERYHGIIMDFGLGNPPQTEKLLNEMRIKDPESYNAEMALRPIMRLHKDLDGHLRLRYLMAEEQRTIARVKKLQECIRNGVRTKKVAEIFLKQKEERRMEEELRKSHSLELHTETQSSLLSLCNTRSNPKKLSADSRRRTFDTTHSTIRKAKPVRRKTDVDRRNTEPASGNMQSPSGDMQSPSGDMQSPSGDMQSPSGDMQSPSGDSQSPNKRSSSKRKAKAPKRKLAAPRRKTGETTLAFNRARAEFHKLLDDCAGVEKLTSEEKEMCTTRMLHPKDYLFYKERLIRCYEKFQTLSLSTARNQLRIDNSKIRFIYDFLVLHGYVKNVK